MIDLPYSLIIEATEEHDYFGFYSPDLEGFSGIGHSIEDCIYKAKWGMIEHIALLKEKRLSVPFKVTNPKIIPRCAHSARRSMPAPCGEIVLE
jgi:predicted RNase H-like HicB family nuclease